MMTSTHESRTSLDALHVKTLVITHSLSHSCSSLPHHSYDAITNMLASSVSMLNTSATIPHTNPPHIIPHSFISSLSVAGAGKCSGHQGVPDEPEAYTGRVDTHQGDRGATHGHREGAGEARQQEEVGVKQAYHSMVAIAVCGCSCV